MRTLTKPPAASETMLLSKPRDETAFGRLTSTRLDRANSNEVLRVEFADFNLACCLNRARHQAREDPKRLIERLGLPLKDVAVADRRGARRALDLTAKSLTCCADREEKTGFRLEGERAQRGPAR
jgi:hypothetical protein